MILFKRRIFGELSLARFLMLATSKRVRSRYGNSASGGAPPKSDGNGITGTSVGVGIGDPLPCGAVIGPASSHSVITGDIPLAKAAKVIACIQTGHARIVIGLSRSISILDAIGASSSAQ